MKRTTRRREPAKIPGAVPVIYPWLMFFVMINAIYGIITEKEPDFIKTMLFGSLAIKYGGFNSLYY